MSVKKNKLITPNSIYGIGAWEFHPDLGSLQRNNNNNQTNLYKKVTYLKRGKTFTMSKYEHPNSAKTEFKLNGAGTAETRKQEKKKLRNAKELENFRSARSHSADSVNEQSKEKPWTETLRTRSMSPTPATPPLNAELPLRKFYSYSTKIIEQLEIVKIFTDRQPDAAESLHEINRQRKRATEFAVRFSRNNLYQMRRIVNEIKQIVVPYPFENLAKCDSEILCKKILLAYQTASQSLQSYLNYMKSGQSMDVPEKARELILLIMDFYLCCEHLSLPGYQLDILTLCKELISLLDMKIAEVKEKTPIIRTTGDCKETGNEDKRFAMYRTKLTNSNWKKKTEALAKIKFGAPKLSYLKKIKKKEGKLSLPKSTLQVYCQNNHDPPLDHVSSKMSADDIDEEEKRKKKNMMTKLTKQVCTEKTPCKKYHCTPREVTSQDDDIETVVQTIDSEDPGAPLQTSSELTSTKATEYHRDGINYLHRSNVEQLVLKTIQEIQSSDNCNVKSSLNNLLKSLNFQAYPNGNPPQNVKVFHVVAKEPTIPEETEQEITREKNAEGYLNSCNAKADKGDNADSVLKERKNLFVAALASGCMSEPEAKRTSIKYCEKSAKVFIKYKGILNEYRRNNIMYKRGIPIRPSELVLRISDQIVNEVLMEISSGLENEHLLKQLYYNELSEAA